MTKEHLTLAAIINSLGTKYDLLDLVDYLADLFFAQDEESRQAFREKCLFTQYEQII
jgi:hypothetical protein